MKEANECVRETSQFGSRAKITQLRSDGRSIAEPSPRWLWMGLLLSFGVAMWLRFSDLGTIFSSADSAYLPWWVSVHSGWLWVGSYRYGMIAPLLIKALMELAAWIGIHVTEFWWRLPIACCGALSVFCAERVLAAVGGSRQARLLGAWIIAVMPLAVSQSRYAWGNSAVAVLLCSICVLVAIRFFRVPNQRNGWQAVAVFTLYLVSTGLSPVIVGLIVWIGVVLIGRGKTLGESVVATGRRLWNPWALLLPGVATVALLLAWRLGGYYSLLGHIVGEPLPPGFYVLAHAPQMIGATGWAWFTVLVVSMPRGIHYTLTRDVRSIPFVWGVLYLLPFLLFVPPETTVLHDLLLHSFFPLSLHGALVVTETLESWSWQQRPVARWAAVGCLVVSLLLGSVIGSGGQTRLQKLTGVNVVRGHKDPDPGYKSAGYYIRRFVPQELHVLSVAHGGRGLESYVHHYYFGNRGVAFDDLKWTAMEAKFKELKSSVDVLVIESGDLAYFQQQPEYERVATVRQSATPLLYIYARKQLNLPMMNLDVEHHNFMYDNSYAYGQSWPRIDDAS